MLNQNEFPEFPLKFPFRKEVEQSIYEYYYTKQSSSPQVQIKELIITEDGSWIVLLSLLEIYNVIIYVHYKFNVFQDLYITDKKLKLKEVDITKNKIEIIFEEI